MAASPGMGISPTCVIGLTDGDQSEDINPSLPRPQDNDVKALHDDYQKPVVGTGTDTNPPLRLRVSV
jgi:hypothetical protein